MSETSTRNGGSPGLILDRRQLMSGAAALGIGYGFATGPAFADDMPKEETLPKTHDLASEATGPLQGVRVAHKGLICPREFRYKDGQLIVH